MTTPLPKIYVAGHRGMIGSTNLRHHLLHGLQTQQNIIRTHAKLDLREGQTIVRMIRATSVTLKWKPC